MASERTALVDCAVDSAPRGPQAPLALLAPRRLATRRSRSARLALRGRRERLLESLEQPHHVASHLSLHPAPARLALLAVALELPLERAQVRSHLAHRAAQVAREAALEIGQALLDCAARAPL